MLTSTYKKVIKYQFLKKDFFQLLHYENAVLFMKGKNNRTVFLNTCLVICNVNKSINQSDGEMLNLKRRVILKTFFFKITYL